MTSINSGAHFFGTFLNFGVYEILKTDKDVLHAAVRKNGWGGPHVMGRIKELLNGNEGKMNQF